MSWESTDPATYAVGKILAPLVLHPRKDTFEQYIRKIDETTSDARTLDLVSTLLMATDPAIVAEVGTYRGIGAMVMAETIHTHELRGHVWTCDPVDYEVNELLRNVGLQTYVTYVQGDFEKLLDTVSPLDFCYIDASSKDEASLRLRYTLMALESVRPGGLVVVDDAGGDWLGSVSLRRLAKRHGLYLPSRRGVVVMQV